MSNGLASAEVTDLAGSGWRIVVIAIGVIVLASVLALVPIAIGRYRLHRRAQQITAAAILWGFLAAGSVLYTANAQIDWSKEWWLLVKTGYYDPNDNSGAPAWPWGLWIVLAAAYGALAICSLARKKPKPAAL